MKRILIIEDNDLVAGIYQRKFAFEGYQVDIAGDAESAIKIFDRKEVDLVLLDLRLPKGDGLDILKHIRTQASVLDLPVFVLTNVYFGNILQQAKEAGANQVFSKADYRPDQVIQEIRNVLGALSASPPEPQLKHPSTLPV